jgi:hypothetical protein
MVKADIGEKRRHGFLVVVGIILRVVPLFIFAHHFLFMQRKHDQMVCAQSQGI